MSNKYYQLQVIRLEGLRWGSILYRKRPNLYVVARLGSLVQRTSIITKNTSPAWNETLMFTSEEDSALFEVQVWHRSRWLCDLRVGFLHISINSLLARNGEATFDIHSSSRRASSSPVGLITLHLVASDSMSAVGKAIEDVEKNVRQRGIARSQGASDIMQSITDGVTQVGDQGDLYQAVGVLLSKLDVFCEAMDVVSEIHPFLAIAWRLTSGLYKVVRNVFETDKRIVDLVLAIGDAFSFARDIQAIRDKVAALQRPIGGLVKQTIECCFFVQQYTGRGFVGRAIDYRAGQKIDEFERALSSFKKEIDSGVAIYTTIVSLRASRGIDEILLRQRLNPNMNDGSGRPTCLPGTRMKIRSEIIDWALSDNTRNVFWLCGVAGSGKSTISTTVADRLREMSRLGAFLFFERGRSEPSSVIRTVAYKLALFDDFIGSSIISGIESDKDITSASLAVQFNTLLLQPLRTAAVSMQGPITIVLDALDECGTVEKRSDLMKLFKHELPKLPNIFRFLITSRREPDIDKVLSSHPINLRSMELDYSSAASQVDVLAYLRSEVHTAVREQVEVPVDWMWDKKMAMLGTAAGGLFIWASTAVKIVQNSDNPFYQLDRIVSDSRLLSSSGMDGMYATVLRDSGIAWQNERSKDRFVKLFGLLLLSKVPLTCKAIDGILGFSPQEPSFLVLSRLRSVVSYSDEGPVGLFHMSFADYLLSPECAKEPWSIDIPAMENIIAGRCFSIMERHLHFNICGLQSSFVRNDNVPGLADRVKEQVAPHLEYVCLYWSHHLIDVPDSPDLLGKLSDFACRRLLYWFEVLSLLEVFACIAYHALLDAAAWAEPRDSKTASFLRDASRLASMFAPAIARSTPHIYVSMIPLSKDDSQVAAHYSHYSPLVVRVERRGVKRPPMYSKVLEGHSSAVLSVAFSPDGSSIASASKDKAIRIWDVDSGLETVAPLTGHTDAVLSVNYSHDGKRVVSGSRDKTLRVWDAENGDQVLGPLDGHNGAIHSVAFSRDGHRIASASTDNTIIIWYAAGGKRALDLLTGHTKSVNFVDFSTNGTRLVSCSDDETIIVWNLESGKLMFGPLKGHSGSVRCVAFSPDGKHVASVSHDRTVKIWDLESGNAIYTLRGHSLSVLSVAYSPCGTRIVSGSWDKTIIVWNAEDGKVASGPFKGHSDIVWSIAWSSDGKYIVSGSEDKTARIWDVTAGTDESESELSGHSGPVMSVVVSPDGRRIVSGSIDRSIIVWDAQSGNVVFGPLLGHTEGVTCIAFSSDGLLLASGSDDKTIRLWNAETGGMFLDPLVGHSEKVWCIALSPDATKLVSGSWDRTIMVWDTVTGQLVAGPLHGHLDHVLSVDFSPDGKRLASGSRDKEIKIWNTETWECIHEALVGHVAGVESVRFSPDGSRIASGSDDHTIIIWDADNGSIVSGPLRGHTNLIWSVIFSPDGKFVFSGSWDSTIRIWDAETGRSVCEPLEGHASDIQSLSLSPDGSRLFSGSYDNTIRVWDVSDLLQNAGDSKDNSAFGNGRLSDWVLGGNGWILGGDVRRELLLWVPPDLRPTLWRPRNTGIFSCEFLTKLDFSEAALGERWTECFKPLVERRGFHQTEQSH